MYAFQLGSDSGFAVRGPETPYEASPSFLPRATLDVRFPPEVEAEERARVMHEGLLFLALASARAELEIGEGIRRPKRGLPPLSPVANRAVERAGAGVAFRAVEQPGRPRRLSAPRPGPR
jgi:hypothetical protein